MKSSKNRFTTQSGLVIIFSQVQFLVPVTIQGKPALKVATSAPESPCLFVPAEISAFKTAYFSYLDYSEGGSTAEKLAADNKDSLAEGKSSTAKPVDKKQTTETLGQFLNSLGLKLDFGQLGMPDLEQEPLSNVSPAFLAQLKQLKALEQGFKLNMPNVPKSEKSSAPLSQKTEPLDHEEITLQGDSATLFLQKLHGNKNVRTNGQPFKVPVGQLRAMGFSVNFKPISLPA